MVAQWERSRQGRVSEATSEVDADCGQREHRAATPCPERGLGASRFTTPWRDTLRGQACLLRRTEDGRQCKASARPFITHYGVLLVEWVR
jgi:hypothetical protein